MRKAAFAALLLLVGCTSREDVYRDHLECVTVQDLIAGLHAEQGLVPEATVREDRSALKIYRRRLADQARLMGKTEADVARDIRAFESDIQERSANAHGTEEYLEQVMARCALNLES